MSNVAIVGIGMHEFGRNDGISGMDQGVVAVRRALADCGQQWSDMQFAVGGSMDGGAADTMVSRVGLTGLPFTNVVNGCATGGTALAQAVNTIESGAADIGMAIGFDKHEPGAFRIKGPRGKDWYGGSGLALTTQFFGMKITRYMHEYGITQASLAKVGVQGVPQRFAQPDGVAPQAAERAGGPRLADALVPAHPVHVLLARRRRRRDDPVPRRQGQAVHRPPDLPAGRRGAHPQVRFVRGARTVDRARARPGPDIGRVEGGVRDGRHRTAGHRRRPTPGHRGRRRDHAHGRERLLRARRAGTHAGQRRDRDQRPPARSTPTAAASPTANRSVRRACARCTRTCCSCAAMPANARCRTIPRSPTPTCTARRESAASRSSAADPAHDRRRQDTHGTLDRAADGHAPPHGAHPTLRRSCRKARRGGQAARASSTSTSARRPSPPACAPR